MSDVVLFGATCRDAHKISQLVLRSSVANRSHFVAETNKAILEGLLAIRRCVFADRPMLTQYIDYRTFDGGRVATHRRQINFSYEHVRIYFVAVLPVAAAGEGERIFDYFRFTCSYPYSSVNVFTADSIHDVNGEYSEEPLATYLETYRNELPDCVTVENLMLETNNCSSAQENIRFDTAAVALFRHLFRTSTEPISVSFASKTEDGKQVPDTDDVFCWVGHLHLLNKSPDACFGSFLDYRISDPQCLKALTAYTERYPLLFPTKLTKLLGYVV
jgi:hypothetical protein